MPDIVLIAHGSPDPRHAEGVERLVDAVRDRVRAGRAVGACYLDHHGPSPSELASELSRAAVAVPVLLTPAYHARMDIPQAVQQLAASGSDVRLVATLGPDPRLLDACEELLAMGGVSPDPDTSVIVFVAGSSDTAAVETVSETIAQSPRTNWGPWRVAALDGGAQVEDVAAELRQQNGSIVAVSFMVAEGVLRDRMVARCDSLGIQMVAGALSATSVLADLVVTRANGV